MLASISKNNEMETSGSQMKLYKMLVMTPFWIPILAILPVQTIEGQKYCNHTLS